MALLLMTIKVHAKVNISSLFDNWVDVEVVCSFFTKGCSRKKIYFRYILVSSFMLCHISCLVTVHCRLLQRNDLEIAYKHRNVLLCTSNYVF